MGHIQAVQKVYHVPLSNCVLHKSHLLLNTLESMKIDPRISEGSMTSIVRRTDSIQRPPQAPLCPALQTAQAHLWKHEAGIVRLQQGLHPANRYL